MKTPEWFIEGKLFRINGFSDEIWRWIGSRYVSQHVPSHTENESTSVGLLTPAASCKTCQSPGSPRISFFLASSSIFFLQSANSSRCPPFPDYFFEIPTPLSPPGTLFLLLFPLRVTQPVRKPVSVRRPLHFSALPSTACSAFCSSFFFFSSHHIRGGGEKRQQRQTSQCDGLNAFLPFIRRRAHVRSHSQNVMLEMKSRWSWYNMTDDSSVRPGRQRFSIRCR